MAKYTVTLTQAHITYTQATVEVEAESDRDAGMLAKLAAKMWERLDSEDDGHLDIDVKDDIGSSMSWRED